VKNLNAAVLSVFVNGLFLSLLAGQLNSATTPSEKSFSKETKASTSALSKVSPLSSEEPSRTSPALPNTQEFPLNADDALGSALVSKDNFDSFSFARTLQQDLAYKDDAVDQKPIALARRTPAYPIQARSQGIEGFAEYKLHISAEGEVVNISLLSADPAGYFEEACREALNSFRFQPAIKSGEPVPVLITQKFHFNLED